MPLTAPNVGEDFITESNNIVTVHLSQGDVKFRLVQDSDNVYIRDAGTAVKVGALSTIDKGNFLASLKMLDVDHLEGQKDQYGFGDTASNTALLKSIMTSYGENLVASYKANGSNPIDVGNPKSVIGNFGGGLVTQQVDSSNNPIPKPFIGLDHEVADGLRFGSPSGVNIQIDPLVRPLHEIFHVIQKTGLGLDEVRATTLENKIALLMGGAVRTDYNPLDPTKPTTTMSRLTTRDASKLPLDELKGYLRLDKAAIGVAGGLKINLPYDNQSYSSKDGSGTPRPFTTDNIRNYEGVTPISLLEQIDNFLRPAWQHNALENIAGLDKANFEQNYALSLVDKGAYRDGR